MTSQRLCAAAALVFLAGCGNGTSGAFGPAPQIMGLGTNPTSLVVGSSTNVNASFDFYTHNGNLLFMFTQVEEPSGQLEPVTRFDVRYAYGIVQGALETSVPVLAASAGNYRLHVWVKDSNGQNSNRLTRELAASP